MRKPLIEGKNHFYAVYYLDEVDPCCYSAYNAYGWCRRSIKKTLASADNPFTKAELYLENSTYSFPSHMYLINTYYQPQDE